MVGVLSGRSSPNILRHRQIRLNTRQGQSYNFVGFEHVPAASSRQPTAEHCTGEIGWRPRLGGYRLKRMG